MEQNNVNIVVYDEEGNEIKAFFILDFEIPEFNKKYVVYTLDLDSDKEDMEVLISEIDYETNEVKSIPTNEMETVLNVYEELKQQLLNDEVTE